MTRTGSIPLTAGTVIADKYALEKPLARGGMGSVWVAKHIALDEPVAIKLINRPAYHFGEAEARLRQDAEMRLQREAKSAARLRSPHIVQLLDYGVDRGMPYIVMELLEGEHLGARIRRKGRLSLAVAANIAEQVAKALRRAHKAGIIHRDLKPDNIFMARIDDEEIVKLLDFGLVKAVRGTLSGEPTQSDMLMGSLHYMSPEQTLGLKDIDHRTDLWSLGVIIFEMITGESPFGGGSIVDVILKIRSGPIPLPTDVTPDLPAEIDVFFERALQREPGQRFASAQSMVSELGALVKRLGPLAQRVGGPPSPESQRITMEVSSSDFLLDDVPGVETPAAQRTPSDAALTERKVPSFPEEEAEQPRPFSQSLQLAPTSMVPREASQPEISVSITAVDPPRSRRASRFPKTLNGPASVTPAAPTRVPASPTRQVSTAEVASPPRSPPIPETVASAPTDAPPPRSTKAPPASKRVGPRGSAPPREPPKAPPLPKTVASPLAAAVPELPKDSAFARIVAVSAPSPPPEPSKAPVVASEPAQASAFARILESSGPAPVAEPNKASGFGRKARAAVTITSATAESPGAPPKGSVAELIDQGFAAIRAGDRKRAKQCWEEAWRRDPSNRSLELNLRKLEAKDR